MQVKVIQEYVCSECGSQMLPMFDNAKRKFYMLCPGTGIGSSKENCSLVNIKVKIPEVFVEVEPYE